MFYLPIFKSFRYLALFSKGWRDASWWHIELFFFVTLEGYLLKKAFVFVKTSLHSVQQTIHLCQEAQNFYHQDRNGKTPFLLRGNKYMYIYIFIYTLSILFIAFLDSPLSSPWFMRSNCQARTAGLPVFLADSAKRKAQVDLKRSWGRVRWYW